MVYRLTLILCLCIGCSLTGTWAQETDNTASYRNVNADKYIRLSGDDDFLNHTDAQYSEGLSLEYCAPGLKKFPLSGLLLHPPLYRNSIKYGISLEQSGYTPDNIKAEKTARNDRPFAGTLMLNTLIIATDYEKRQRFSTTLSTGVIGPAALGREIQNTAHHIIGNVQPAGWKYQVRNDIILNYELNYEVQVWSYGHIISVDADAMTHLGTLSDKVCPGSTIMLGYFDSPFSTARVQKRTRFYVYDHPEVNFVGYDATLQGGVFNNSNPYTLSANDISRTVFKNRSGIVFAHNGLSVEYCHVYQSKQFLAGHEHSWDGLQITTMLNYRKAQYAGR